MKPQRLGLAALKPVRAMLAAVMLAGLSACSKLTLEHYSRIGVGMPYEQVVELIGEPERCDDVMGMRHCTWGDDQRSATVTFAGGRVLLFASSNLK